MKSKKLNQIEVLISIVSLGLCSALEEGTITIDEAEHILFSPHTMTFLKKNNAAPNIIEMIHGGTELENLERLIPEEFQKSVLEIKRQALKALKEKHPYDLQQDKWLNCLSNFN